MTITCADCGSTQTLPDLPPGATARCRRCHRLLGHRSPGGNDVALACAVAMFILLPPAVFMPLMDSTIQNLVFESSRLVSSVPEIYSEVWFPFAFGFLFCAFLIPTLRALLLVVVLGSLKTRWKVAQRGLLFRWSENLRIWSMTDVVVIAGLIAYFRADVSAQVAVRIGAWCYVAVAILAFVADRSLDRRAIWSAILPDSNVSPDRVTASCDACELTLGAEHSGERCPRCGIRLDRPIAPRFAPVLGVVAAAIPLCLPAYSASVIVNQQLTGVLEHTVFGTVELFTDRGYWQFGVITFVAGVAIPLLTLAGMIWLLARVRFPERKGLVTRTRFYRLLYRLVRWPMIIPFIAAIAAPIVDFHGIDDIVAGYGATPLFLLIALMMLAIRLFEPRLMWMTAGETR